MRITLIFLITVFCSLFVFGKKTSFLKISTDRHYIETADGKPFLWLGDTGWELIQRLNKSDARYYLSDRAKKGFTVIQTVILAELDVLNTPNAYGELPLIDKDPTKINKKYFEQVDFVIREANKLGLYIALLPSWGDKWNKKWGVGPEIFTPQNAERFGEIIARRYKSFTNIIWVLGGDRAPEAEVHTEIINAMAKGIRSIDTTHLITYHPVGTTIASDFFNKDWLDIDMFQSGHDRRAKEYQYVLKCSKKSEIRPVINGEARYENIPNCFWEKYDEVWLDQTDVRNSAYWTMFSGAAGYTYGTNDVWQMYDRTRQPIISARTDWKESLQLPGATQMTYLKKLLEIFPWQKMVYSPEMIVNDNPEDESHIICSVGEQKDFLLAYTPFGRPIKIDFAPLKCEKINAYWFNPRSGKVKFIGDLSTNEPHEFAPWATGRGSDFVLVLVDVNSVYHFISLNN